MYKQRLYIDTSVIGGCFDKEFAEWSNLLFNDFIYGNKIAVISEITNVELQKAPKQVQNRIFDIPSENLEIVQNNDEVDFLAKKYLNMRLLVQKTRRMHFI